MKKLNPIHAATFIICLVIITASILGAAKQFQVHSKQQVKQTQEILKEKTRGDQLVADKKAEHAAYLARYTDVSFLKPGIANVAVVVNAEDESFRSALVVFFSERLKSPTVEILPDFFTSSFISDGLFNKVFQGETEVFKKLELENSLAGIVLVQPTITYTTNPDLKNAITAELQTEIITAPVAKNIEKRSWSYLANGIGFTKNAARQLAEERILRQMTNDTTISSLGFNKK